MVYKNDVHFPHLERTHERPPLWGGLFDTLRPRQDGRCFTHDTFKRIFLNENVRISIKISLKSVPKGPINNNPALVQIMTWRRPGDKPLSEPMLVKSLTHICVTRPQWVKGFHDIDGLVQERHNSSALAVELRLSCTKPLISYMAHLAMTLQWNGHHLMTFTTYVLSDLAGGDGRPWGEQISERWTASLHLWTFQGWMGQAGQMGRHSQHVLAEREMAYTSAEALVSRLLDYRHMDRCCYNEVQKIMIHVNGVVKERR